MQHYITLGNGSRVQVAAYVDGIKRAKASPGACFDHGLGGWWSETGAEIVAAFRRHVVAVRCNRGLEVPRDVSMKRAHRRGWEATCRNCGAAFWRHNESNENARFCSAECLADWRR
jgi:hypothetical protein